jgi:hypothetical protein
MLGWAKCGTHKKCDQKHYTKLVFLHLVRSMNHIVYSVASGVQNVDALFFMLGWARCGSHKKLFGTHYAKLMFLDVV